MTLHAAFRIALTLGIGIVTLPFIVSECSPNDGSGDSENGGAGNTGPGGVGGAGANRSDGGIINQPDGGGLLGDGQACATDAYGAIAMPLDIYIMMDRSDSMGSENKWSNVTDAVQYFLSQSPATDGMGVGINFFPATSRTEVCDLMTFQTPKIEIGVLPGVKDAILGAITAAQMGFAMNTPTRPALEGAINHAKSWLAGHVGHKVIVLLATDGEPTGMCNPNTAADVAKVAAAGLPDIKTYVIGVGSSLVSLNQIASAGGTGQAFLVDTGGSAQQQLIDALNTIRSRALGCEYAIPKTEAGTVDPNLVNVKFSPAPGTDEIIKYVETKDKCDPTAGGWYYDDPARPTKILMCDATCKRMEGSPIGKKLEILLGCQTVAR